MKKVGQFFKCLIPIAILLGVQVLVSMIISTIMVARYTISIGGNDYDAILRYSEELSTDTNFLLQVSAIFEVIAFVIFAIIYFAGMKSKINTISRHFTKKTVPTLILLFAGFELTISSVMIIIDDIFPTLLDEYEELIESSGLADLSLISTLLTLVCAPVVEEIAFRGITFKWAGKLFDGNFWLANIFQAALFGIAHMNIVQGLYAFCLGLVLGFVVNKYKSLWASVIGHLTFNFAGTYLVSIIFSTDDSAAPFRTLVVLAVSLVALVAAFLLLNKDKTYVEEVVREEEPEAPQEEAE